MRCLRILRLVAALLALAPIAARAEADAAAEQIPGGHFYFGLALDAVQPFGLSLIRRERLTLGWGSGLYAHYEGQHFLVGAEIGGGRFGHDDTYSNPVMIAVRAGPVLGSGRHAFYVAVGPALLAYGAVGDDAATATGLTAEVGVLLFRDLRWGRLTAFAQYNLPISSDGGKGSEHVTSLSWAALGVRFEL